MERTVFWILCCVFAVYLSCASVEPGTQRSSLDNIDLYETEWNVRTFPVEDVPVFYSVKKGDTLFSIARRYGLTVDNIKSINAMSSNIIRPGMELRLQRDEIFEEEFDLGFNEYDLNSDFDDLDAEFKNKSNPSNEKVSKSGYIWPVNGTVAKRYDPVKGIDGIEIRARKGERVVSSKNGKVVFRSFMSGLGKVVIIEHAHKYLTLYGYLSEITVNCQDFVSRGDIIGTVGSSGSSVESCLHFRIYVNYGNTINPMKVLTER